MDRPLVSVIMGVYNEKNRGQLELAIDSILSQTLEELELIICDDGSEPSCREMLGQICARDDRIWGKRDLIPDPEREDFLFGSPFMHPTIMVRRAVLDRLGGYCTEDFALRTEDYELFIRLYELGERGHNLPERLFCYREDRDSYARRKYRYRLREFEVRRRGFARLGIAAGNKRYIVKPLIVGLIPGWLMKRYKRRKAQR